MTRVTLFGGAMLVVFLGVFAISRLTSPRQTPLVRVRTRDGSVVEFPVQAGSARGGLAGAPGRRGDQPPAVRGDGVVDPTLASFLRQAHVAQTMFCADNGTYTRDVTVLHLTRPANTQLHILSSGFDGLRMSAVNTKTGKQCDVFSGDSAKWAFGYAYDVGRPACGDLR